MSNVNDKAQDQFGDLFGGADEVVLDPIDVEDNENTVNELPTVGTSNTGIGSVLGGLDLSVLSSMPGVIVGNTGVTVSRYPVPRTKFSKNGKSLISILSDNVIVAKTHYDEEIGTNFLCFGGECCRGDLARVRYVYPILVYTTDEKGKPISKNVKFEALCVGQEAYDALTSIQEMKGSLTQYDILVTCSDEQYQKCTFTEAGAARWQKIDGMDKKINDFWSQNMKHILKGIARSITPEEYNELKGKSFAANNENVDFDSVFN